MHGFKPLIGYFLLTCKQLLKQLSILENIRNCSPLVHPKTQICAEEKRKRNTEYITTNLNKKTHKYTKSLRLIQLKRKNNH